MNAHPVTDRDLIRVPVPPGVPGAHALLEVLPDALAGHGPAIAPVPVVSTTTSQDYVAAVLTALRPDDPNYPLESEDVAIVVSTSGSTGSPRGVLLTAGNLAPGTRAANGPNPESVQWVCALPVTSIGGLNVLVRSLSTGREPIVMESIGGGRPFSAPDFAHAVAKAHAHACDIRTSLVPAQLAKLLTDDASIDALRACSFILIGGAAVRPSLRHAAAELGIGISTSYGATETAGGCVIDGMPIPGTTVTLHDSRILIRGDVVAHGYRCDPESSALSFREGGFLSSDFGDMDADGRLQVLGRVDDIVVINGVNVSPMAVEQVIADLPDVASAAVVAMADVESEPALIAFVQVRDSASMIPDAVAEAVALRLGRVAIPRRIVLVDSLPFLPHGKVDRRALLERARSGDE